MSKDNSRKDGRNVGASRADGLVRRAEGLRLGSLLGLGRLGGWTRALSGAFVAAACSPALAGPEGANVVRGNVSISRDGAQTLIRAGRNSIINYRSFDIGRGESVRFIQPDASSRVLNRITTAAPTHIDGGLFANGRVYIVNPAGVIFGNGAMVNTAGLYAAGGHLSDKDFVRGINNFTNLKGEVVNQGQITADFVGLVGRHVSNMGSIVAPQGTVVMGAGQDALVGERSGNVFVRLKGGASTGSSGATGAAADNSGTINARGGQVIMGAGDIYAMAVRTTGAVTAKDVKLEAQGRGSVVVSGDINASNQNRGKGGSVDVLGQQISVINAKIDASGDRGGGQVHIGGDYQGKGSRQHADTVHVNEGSNINVSATGAGNGGTAIVWSDQHTTFYGTATARGGEAGGNGGLIETSSHETVNLSPAKIDAGAGAGFKGGSWLIDPRDVNIATTDSHIGSTGTNPVTIAPDTGGPPNTPSSVDVTTIQASLNTGTSVIVTTAQTGRTDAGNIDVQNSITKTAGGDASLTLIAMNNITVQPSVSISSTTGKLNVDLQANQTNGGDAASGLGNVVLNGSINTNGGSFSSSGKNFTSASTGTINTSAASSGTITLNHSGTVGIGGAWNAGGAVGVTGTGGITLNAGITANNANVTFSNSTTVGTSSLAVAAGTGTIGFTGGLTLGANNFTLTGDEIDFGGGANSVTGTGTITLQPGADATSIGIAGGAGTLDISTTDLAALANGFSQINIGRATGTGAIKVNAVTFNDPVLIRTPGSGGSITVDGQITGAGNASITLTGFGSTTTLNADIVTNGAAIQINDAVILGANILLDSTNGGAAAAGANIGITGTVNATTLATEGLTLRAGTAGDIHLGGILGGTIALGAFQVTSAHNVTLDAALHATTITQLAGTGTGTYSGLLDASAAGGIALTGTSFSLTGGASTIANGAFSLANSGASTISTAALNLGGAFTQTGVGTLTLSTNITTSGDAVSFAAPVVLGAAAAIDTTSSAAAGNNIIFSSTVNGTTAGTEGLTLNAGTGGNISSGAMGGTTRLGLLTVTNANDVTTGALTLGAFLQSAGGGTTQVNGAINTSGGLNLTGNVFNLTSTITTGAGAGLVVANTGQLTLGGTATLDGAFTQSGGGPVQINGSISTTNDVIGILNNVTVGANGLTFDAGSSQVNFGGTLTLAANAFTISGNTINFFGPANSVTGTSTLVLQPGVDGTSIGVAGGAGTLNLSLTNLAALANGFSQITIGRATGSQAITINAATFNDPVVFRSPGGGTITVAGNLMGAAASDATITISGTSQVHLNANIVTDGRAIQINAPVLLGVTALLDSTNAGGTATGANIGVTGAIDATAAGTQGLTLRAGTAGDIALGAAGGTTRLGAFTITSTHDAATGAVTATTVTQTAGTGSSSFGNLNTSAAGGVSLTGAAFTLAGATTTNGGTFAVTNTGTLTIGTAALNLDGAFSQSGAGATALNQGITTTNDSITFAGNVTAGVGVTSLDAGTATVSFGGSLALGANAFTIGGNTIAFNGGANSVTGTSTIALQPATNATSIGVAGGAGTLQLSTATLGALANGFSQIIIGRAAGAHVITVNAVTFQDPVNFRSPSGSIAVNGNINGTGDASVTLTGTATLGANVVTAGQGILVTGNLIVNGLRSLDTTNGAATGADIGVTGTINGTTAGTDVLTLAAGTAGNISLGGAVGGTTRLGIIEVATAHNVTTVAVTSDEITQDAGTGTTTFNGALSARAGGINLTGTAFTLNAGATTTNGGAMVVNNSGTFTVANSAVDLDGAFNQIGAGASNIGAALTTTDDAITFTGAVTAGAGLGGLDAGTATITINSTLALGANNFTLTANDLAFNGGANSVTGSGALTLQPGAAGVSIGIGGAPGTFTLGATELGALANGFSQIIIGRADGAHAISIDPVTFNDPVVIRTPLGGSIAVNGDMHGAGNSSLTLTGAVTLAANLVTDGNAITINGPLTLVGGLGGNLDSTNAGGFAGADIGITGTTNGTVADAQNLTLRAGAGDISLGGDVGGTTRLNGFAVLNAHNVTGAGVAARGILQIAGTGAAPTTTFTGLLDASFSGVNLTTNTINISGGITTANNVGVLINNAGLLTISGTAWTLDGSFAQSGGGSVHLGTGITTTNDSVSFLDDVTLTGVAAINTGAGAGDITFSDTVDGTFALTLAAGTGNVTFANNIGAGTILGALTVSSSGSITLGGSVHAASADLTSTGAVIANNTVTTPGGFSSTGTTFQNAAAITTTNNDITIDHSGAVTINGSLSAGTGAISLSSGSAGAGNLTFGAAIDLTADSIALGAGSGSGTAIVDALTNTPQFHGATGGATSPSSFIFRQDAAISGADLPATTQFAGGISGMAYTVNSTNGVVTVDDATRVAGTDLTLSGTGAGVTGILINTDLALNALHAITGITISNNVTTANGDILLDGPARTLASVTLDAGTGTIAFGDTLAMDGTDLTLTGADLDLLGAATAGANGTLLIQTSDPAHDIFLGGTGLEGTGDMHLQSAEIANIGAGFGTVTIGRSNMTGTIHVNSGITLSSDTILRSPTTVLTGDIRTNGVDVSLTGNVVVAANVTVETTNNGAVGAGANIGITGTVDADAVSNNRTLVLYGGTGGAITVGGAVGATQRLATFTASAATVALKNVSTLGAQNYDGTLTLDGNLDLNTAGAINILGHLVLASDSTIHTAGGLATDDINAHDIDADGTAHSLTMDAGANGNVIAGVIGGSSPLSNLTITGAASSVQGATTTGFQTYNGPVTIFGNLSGTSIAINGVVVLEDTVTVTGATSVVFEGTVRSQTDELNSLTVNAPTTVFNGDIGGLAGSELGSLTTDAGGLLNIHAGVINTVGAVSLGDAATIFADLVITSSAGGVTFGSTLNSDTLSRAITINTGGGSDTVFSGAVGGIQALSTITTNADGHTRVGGNITTTGEQNFNDAVILTADMTFDASGLNFDSTIDSDGTTRTLTMNAHTGQASVAGVIGGNSPMSSLTITSGTSHLAGATTTGAQSITGDLTLGGNLVSTTAGSIDVVGALNVSANSSIFTAGGASDHVTVTGAINSPTTAHALTLNAGSGNVSMISNVGATAALSSLTATGANIVAHAVTTTGSQTYSGALTVDNSLISNTLGSIGINGSLKLDADVTITTANGGVTFNGTVDSGLLSHSLTINTGGNGLTRFLGAVGNTSILTTLTTNADGTTRIDGGTIRTSGDQTFADGLILGADTTLAGKNLIFQNVVNSDSSATARALTVNSSSTGDTRFQAAVGSVARLKSITTNADGVTKIGAALNTTSGMTFADQIKLTGNTTLDGGSGTLFFQKAIDADSSATDPFLTLFSTGAADADITPFKFAASIGVARRLGGFNLGSDRAAPLAATAIFTDSFNAAGRVAASGVGVNDTFTVNTGNGGFTMGRGQKLTSFGGINIITTGTAALGDLSALTNIKVTANQIVIKLRSGSEVLDNVFETPADQRASDSGVDFVASGTIDFNKVPTLNGSGGQPSFCNDQGLADVQLLGFGFRQFPNGVRQALFADPRTGHAGELLPLDLKGEGPSVTSIASSIAGAIPRDTETREVATPVTVGKALRDPLQEMGVATKDLTVDDMIEFMVGRSMYRDLPLKARPTIASGDYQVTVNRLSMSTVEAAVESYRGLVFTPALDETGAPKFDANGHAQLVNRTDLIRDTIGEAWDNYSGQAQDPDGVGFRTFLEGRSTSGSKAEKESLSYLKSAKDVLERLDALGLSPFEASIPKRKLLGEIRPPAMTDEQFQAAVSGAKLSMR
jgi:filamentous hemagglutinin family protein